MQHIATATYALSEWHGGVDLGECQRSKRNKEADIKLAQVVPLLAHIRAVARDCKNERKDKQDRSIDLTAY